MLQEGKIRTIHSPYSLPVVLSRKNNILPPDSPEAYRFTIDYRKLNAFTKYPRYPLPVIDDLITNIPHTGIMSTLDLKSGYFQLAISPNDIEKTAFITRNGTFAFLRMPFGLSGAAPNFQKAIDIILKPVIGRFVMVYMEDVIITSSSFNEHIDHLNQVFALLRDAGLTLNKEKCHFACDKLKYLGLIISKEGIEPDNKAPVLQLPNFQEQFNLFTDASMVGIGAVRNQNHRPIAFASRTLNKAERNYTVTERECLAVIWALIKFKTYFGSLPVKSNDYRWALKLSEFNIEWEHRSGVQNVVADELPRNPEGNMDGSQISITVNIDQVRVYHPGQSDTISLYSHIETLYEGQRYSNGTTRSHPVKSQRSRKPSSEKSKGHKKIRKCGLEDPRLKCKVRSNGSVERTDKKRSKICRKKSLQGSEHGDQKRPTPIPTLGIKRTVSSSVSSRKHKYRRPNNPSHGSQFIAGLVRVRVDRTRENPKDLGKLRVRRVRVVNKISEMRIGGSKIEA
ncbi:retrovirus-related Pol polyprotein from transposon 297 [Trichonephila clavipes]|nr:retrovirus-related Pol polyprotein from transposon 297 [Trichonephila clavipes]